MTTCPLPSIPPGVGTNVVVLADGTAAGDEDGRMVVRNSLVDAAYVGKLHPEDLPGGAGSEVRVAVACPCVGVGVYV